MQYQFILRDNGHARGESLRLLNTRQEFKDRLSASHPSRSIILLQLALTDWPLPCLFGCFGQVRACKSACTSTDQSALESVSAQALSQRVYKPQGPLFGSKGTSARYLSAGTSTATITIKMTISNSRSLSTPSSLVLRYYLIAGHGRWE